MKQWGEIDAPWAEIENLADIVLDRVNILDILDKYKIEYAECSSGEFTHRMRCPLPVHANGNERTASMFASKQANSFYCFGCNNGGNVITFLMLYLGIPYYVALDRLAAYAGLSDCDARDISLPRKEKIDPKNTVMAYVFKSGVLIREYLQSLKDKKEYFKYKIWADKQFKRLDNYLDKLEDDQVSIVKTYYEHLKKYLEDKKEGKTCE